MLACVFYNRASWHNLIEQVIKPFINHDGKQVSIENWCIYLDTMQGDHITLAVKSPDDEQAKLLFSHMAVHFLSANPSDEKDVEYPLQSFFMDYPNNSVQFDRDKLLTHSLNSNHQIKQKQEISQALIGALGNDVPDTESIYTFLIYMQLGIIKSVYPVTWQAHSKTAEAFFQYSEVQADPKGVLADDLNDLLKLFENNKEILSEIIKQVWNEDSNDPDLRWLHTWIGACKNFIAETDFRQAFFLLSGLLCKHLGLNDKTVVRLSTRLIISAFDQLPEQFKPQPADR